jgi:hypothetical protein
VVGCARNSVGACHRIGYDSVFLRRFYRQGTFVVAHDTGRLFRQVRGRYRDAGALPDRGSAVEPTTRDLYGLNCNA